ncbi:MAG TPA: NAD(P)H-binding protein [Polyangia bacterium]
MKIGITGASGRLGAATIATLTSRTRDSHLVGISRTPDRVTALGVEARFGDFDQPESLTEAFAGLDRVIIIPSNDMSPGARARQCQEAIRRAVGVGVDHVVFASSVGTRAAEIPHLWQSYFVPEQALMRLAKQWTILRMAYYAETFIDEVRTSLPRGFHTATSNTPVNFVARDDVAAAAAGILLGDGHHGAIYQSTGPAALDGVTCGVGGEGDGPTVRVPRRQRARLPQGPLRRRTDAIPRGHHFQHPGNVGGRRL